MWCIWEQYQLDVQEESLTILDLLAFMVLGGGSAVVSVFLIFNVDRRDKPRLFALGIAGGFAFAFILEAGLPKWLSGEAPAAGIVPSGESAFSPTSIARPGPLDRELAVKVADASSSDNVEPASSEDDGRELVDEIYDRLVRVNDGVDEVFAIEEVEALPFGTWVSLAEDEQAPRLERVIRIPGGQSPSISARPSGDSLQDLMAVLFAVDDDSRLRQVAFNDDAETGSINPRIEGIFDPGDYLLRILPFDDEEIGPVEVRVVLNDVLASELESDTGDSE